MHQTAKVIFSLLIDWSWRTTIIIYYYYYYLLEYASSPPHAHNNMDIWMAPGLGSAWLIECLGLSSLYLHSPVWLFYAYYISCIIIPLVVDPTHLLFAGKSLPSYNKMMSSNFAASKKSIFLSYFNLDLNRVALPCIGLYPFQFV